MKVGMERKGFSLIGLLFVIAIVGILTAIVVPGYSAYSTKAGHTEAMGTTVPVERLVAAELSPILSRIRLSPFSRKKVGPCLYGAVRV